MATNGQRKSGFDINTCARPNILALKPYRCARDDYENNGTNVLLDANENAYGPALDLDNKGRLIAGETGEAVADSSELDLLGLNRYPDPHQIELKRDLIRLRTTHAHTKKSLTVDNLFVGLGSDEAIDALIRAFCRPGVDKILTCPPTYGMYSVSAHVNDVGIVTVPLDSEKEFTLQPDKINEALSQDPTIKLVYLCSPGNPTAKLVDKADVTSVLNHPTWNGVVVVDEAYVDFSPAEASLAEYVTEFPNLVVTQTFSKAFGLAGIRVGGAYTSPQIARLLNNLKAPYNIPSPSSELARRALTDKRHMAVMQDNRDKILKQRDRLIVEMPKVAGIGRFRGGFDANFLLVEVLDRPNGKPDSATALKVYEQMAENQGVVVRFRGKEYGCEGCLRVTVGTDKEVDVFLRELKKVLEDVYSGGASTNGAVERKEKEANAVVS